MQKGVTVCEKTADTNHCYATDCKEYKCVGIELVGWNENMPISICDEHAHNRVPLNKEQLSTIHKLIFNIFIP